MNISHHVHGIKLGTVKTSGNNDSSLPEHSLQEGHMFQFDNFKILHTEKYEGKRKVLEGLKILLHSNAINSCEGKHFKIDDHRLPILKIFF